MGFPRWEPAVRCTDGPTPGASAFMKWFVEEYGDLGGYNLGIYNCRTVRGGSTTSLHGEGRATDLGFPVSDPDGNQLLNRLLKAPGRLGIQCIIYERKIFSAVSPGGRYYGGVNPHYDHLHVEFTREAARKLTYATVEQVLRIGLPKRKRGRRDLGLDDKGTDVRWVQKQVGIEADGYFGPKTKQAVTRYERAALKDFPRLRVDGVVGKLTWKTLGVTPEY
jgi:peptidoglycan hydrolase-like protein with peptidoglycan-binding domain